MSCDQIKSGASSSLDIIYGCPIGPIGKPALASDAQ